MNTFGKTVNTSSELLIQMAPGDQYFSIQNRDASNEIHVRFGVEDASASTGILVGPAEYLEVKTSRVGGSAVQAIAISGAVQVVVTHG